MNDQPIEATLPIDRQRFQLQELLGKGGMGAVYLAHDSVLGREVAVKVVNHERLRAEEGKRLLRREAQTTAALEHENIVRIYDHLEEGDYDFIVMERLEGESLDARLERGPLPTDEVANLGLDLLEGLDFAHDRGFVHRDLKPANIWLTPKKRAKILDFGLAKPVESNESSIFGGQVVGTPAYMAPEQLGGGQTSQSSDLFSLGVVLYEALTGARPFQGEAPEEVTANVLATQYLPAKQRRPDCRALSEAIDALIARRPKDRPGTAAEAAELLATSLGATHQDPRRWSLGLLGVALFILVAASATLFKSPWASRDSRRPSIAIVAISPQVPDLAWAAQALEERLQLALEIGGELQVVSGSRLPNDEIVLKAFETPAPPSAQSQGLQVDHLVVAKLIPVGTQKSDGGDSTIALVVQVKDSRPHSRREDIRIRGRLDEIDSLLSESAARLRASLNLQPLAEDADDLERLLPSGAAGRLYAEGLVASSQSDSATACERFREASRLSSEAALVWWALARCEHGLGRLEQAQRAAETAHRRMPTVAAEYGLQIGAFLARGSHDWPEAQRLYRELTRRWPDDFDHGLQLATYLREAGKVAAAEEELERLESLAVTNVDRANLELARAQNAFQLGRFRETTESAQAASDLGKEQGRHRAVGQALLLQSIAQDLLGDHPGAKATFEAAEHAFIAASDANGLSDALSHHVAILARQGRTGEARRQFEMHREVYALRGDRYHEARMATNLGKILVDQGDLQGAVDLLSQAALVFEASGLDAELGMVQIDLGAAEQLRGRLPLAQEHYTEARRKFELLERPAMLAAVLTNLGELRHLQGDLEGALALNRDALQLNEDLGLLSGAAYDRARVATTLRRQGRFKAALESFQRALATQVSLGELGSSGQTQIGLARLEIDRKNFGSAIEHARAAAAQLKRAEMTDFAIMAEIVEAEANLAAPASDLWRVREILTAARLHSQVSQNYELRLRIELLALRLALAEGSDISDIDRLSKEANEAGFVLLADDFRRLLDA